MKSNNMWKVAALAALLGALGCEKETKQVKDDAAPDAPQATKPADAPADGPVCKPLTLTKTKLPCISLTANMDRDVLAVLRTQADLDALYAAKKGDAPECDAVTAPTFNWDEVSVIGVGAVSGGCSVRSASDLCLGPGGLRATIDIVGVGDCEMMGYINEFYTVPKLPADAAISKKFNHINGR
jgi:hypothetical protein